MPKKTKDIQYYESVGRRRESVARVRLYITSKGNTATVKGDKIKAGDVIINKKPLAEYFGTEAQIAQCLQPLKLTDNLDRFAISVKVQGGGKYGQLDAIIHGLARALCLADEEYRPVLKEYELLTRDPRTRERRKVGTGGRARRQKQSPKR